MNIKWTPRDVAYLIEHHGRKSTKEIAQTLGFTDAAVRGKLSQLGIRLRTRLWTEDEDLTLLSMPDLKPRHLAELLPGRTPFQISHRKYYLKTTHPELFEEIASLGLPPKTT